VDPIFVPSSSAMRAAQLSSFAAECEREVGRSLTTAEALHAFSIEDPGRFWRLFVAWSGLLVSGKLDPACEGTSAEHAVFFPRLRLSYVENVLRGDSARPALTAVREDGHVTRWTRRELTRNALAVAAGLEKLGVGPGDRVVAVAASSAEAVAACLGTAAIGAIWSSVAPDLGAPAILARLAQLRPKVLFFHPVQHDGGAAQDLGPKIAEVRAGLPTLLASIALEADGGVTDADTLSLTSLLEADPERSLGDLPRFPWSHPLFIAFSSGTTGRPKCLVHSAGGTLVEQHKEHRLHSDLGPSDKLYFHTTPGWMMWNWLVSALASGTEIVLYEGAITHPRPDALWDLVARERVTVFGTSPAFLQYSRDAGMVPRDGHDLSSLRAVQSTGSVLKDALFRWVVDAVKAVPVQSISGGTDIMGCFLLGHPWLPVYAGELQSKSLGLDVAAIGDATTGELVCRNAFPSRPIGLYGDRSGARLHESYFAQNPGVWTHGDLVEWTPRGTARIHGRTDGVLNVRGVRIGPAEIYAALEPIDAIADAMALEQRAPEEPDGSRLVLAVVLRAGRSLDRDLRAQIRRTLAERGSAAHVPEVIVDVPELVKTHNGKKAERAARDALNGDPVKNLDALANPEALDALRRHPALALTPTTTASAATEAPLGDTAHAETLRRVLAIWQEVFGAEHVAPDDDFHELGGHSLMAISILVKVHAELGVQLPMGVFLGEGATPEGMAGLVPDVAARQENRCLVAIRPTGTKRPVVWLPGGGGLSAMVFREVSLLLGEDQPVYGFEAQIPRDGDDGSVEVERVAAKYVQELRATLAGPYALFGFSDGSLMAFEVACQLEEAGEVVSPLVIFDADAPVPTSAAMRARFIAYRLRYHVAKLRCDPAGHSKFLSDQLQARIVRPSSNGEVVAGRDLFDTLNQRNREALDRYRSRPLRLFPRSITVILASETWRSALPADIDPRLAWRYHAHGGIDIHHVRGTHLSMLRRPDVEHLAATLRGCLDAAETSVTPSSRSPGHIEHPPPLAALNRPDRFHYAVRLDCFRKENAELAPARGERVILLGDSHVEGFDSAWFPGRDVVNRGIGSDALDAHGAIGLLHRWDRSLLGPDPSHVFVMIGVNDLANGSTVSECIARYEALVACLAREYPEAIVVCQTVPPTRDAYHYLNGSILHFNRAIAARLGARVLDLHGKLADGHGLARRYSSDGLHLGRLGYAVWSNEIHAFMGWPRSERFRGLPFAWVAPSSR